MALTTRLTTIDLVADAEDFLADSLAVIFPDDVMNQHGDAAHILQYTSPHLRAPLHIELADPDSEDDRKLFGHYLWNASLMMAEFVEAGSLGLSLQQGSALALGSGHPDRHSEPHFDVRGLATLELGAGTALPSAVAALLGARRVAVTDYPAKPLLDVLRRNVARNTRAAELSPLSSSSDGAAAAAGSPQPCTDVSVYGHAWGVVDGDDEDGRFARENRAAFDRVLACDCLWMPWQHDALRRSLAWFLRDDGGRAWVVAGFHNGRHNMCGFFEDKAALAAAGLAVDAIWERDVNGEERPWEPERVDDSMRKRWLVVAVLKKTTMTGAGSADGGTAAAPPPETEK
jgi:EEF1A N-terminal glycine/lysine methyltransferase